MAGNPRARVIGFLVIVVVAAALRSIGSGYGLPHVYNPDEVAIMSRALGFARGDLNPHNFLYPTLYFYVLFAWEGAWFVVGRLGGVYASLQAFETSFFVDPSAIYLAGRALSMVTGVATVIVTWRLGTRLFGRLAGVSAAMLLAVAPLAVRDAHYVKHDVPVTLLIMLVHLWLAGLVIDQTAAATPTSLSRAAQERGWAGVGVVAGLAMSTHYYAIFVAVPIAIAACLPARDGEPWSPRIVRLGTAGLATAVAFFAASPFLAIEPGTAIRDIVANREIVMDRVTTHDGLFGSLGFYTTWLAQDAVGTLTFTLAVAGAVATAAAGARRAIVAFAFPVAFLLFIANTFPASRYLNPLLPFIALLAGACCAWLGSRQRVWRSAATLLLVAATTEAAMASWKADLFFRQTDTRTLALAWIEQHLPAGTSVLVQPYSVPMRPSKAGLEEALTAHLGSPDRATIKFRKQLDLQPYPSPAYRTIFLGTGGLDVDKIYLDPARIDAARGLDPVRALAVTHVVLKRYNAPDPATEALVAALERGGHKIASFTPYAGGAEMAKRQAVAPFLHNTDARIDPALERPGPPLEIWTID